MSLAAALTVLAGVSPAAARLNASIVGITGVGTGGYAFAASDGGAFTYGTAQFHGSLADKNHVGTVIGLAYTPDGSGYWMAASDGGVFTFGSAQFYGSEGGKALSKPIVGIAATPDGKGYWLVAADGGIFAFGSAQFYGSMGGKALNKPIVGMAATRDGKGYWLVAADGGIFAYGSAQFYGSMGAKALNKPIVGMAATREGKGYWLAASDGGVFAFGDAPFYGSMGSTPLNQPVVAIAAVPGGGGYWLAAADSGVFAFGSAKFLGNMVSAEPPPAVANQPASAPGRSKIVSIAQAELGTTTAQAGKYGTKAGQAWCAYFATWVWVKAGIGQVSVMSWVGDLRQWGSRRGQYKAGAHNDPRPGDWVIYNNDQHVGIVIGVNGNNITTIEGNSGSGLVRQKTFNPAVSQYSNRSFVVVGYVSPFPLTGPGSQAQASISAAALSAGDAYSSALPSPTAAQLAAQDPAGKPGIATSPGLAAGKGAVTVNVKGNSYSGVLRITGYKIYLSHGHGVVKVDKAGKKTIRNLKRHTSYTVRVAQCDKAGCGPRSPAKKVTTG